MDSCSLSGMPSVLGFDDIYIPHGRLSDRDLMVKADNNQMHDPAIDAWSTQVTPLLTVKNCKYDLIMDVPVFDGVSQRTNNLETVLPSLDISAPDTELHSAILPVDNFSTADPTMDPVPSPFYHNTSMSRVKATYFHCQSFLEAAGALTPLPLRHKRGDSEAGGGMSDSDMGFPVLASKTENWDLMVMTDKVPFHEVNSAGVITLMVIQGEVPETREDAQLAQIITLCSLMKDCWAFNPRARPNIARCCTELKWIPSLPPSAGKASDQRVPSIELLLLMGQMHYRQARPEKATSLFQEALSLANSAGNQTATANALQFLGGVYRFQSKYTQAEESYTRAQELYARIGDDWHRASTLDGLGDLYSLQSKYAQAKESYIRAQEIFARVGNDHGRANTLLGLGHVYRLQSKYTEAKESYTQAQEIYTRVGDDQGRANTLRGQGHVYRDQSKYTQAAESYTRAQDIYARVGDDLGRANALLGLGHVYRLQSKYTQAEEPYTQAQEIYARIGDDLGRANVQRGLGHLRRQQGRNAEAALHFAEAKDLYAQIGSTDNEEGAARWLAVVSPEQDSSMP
ncbi:hypothetical protein FRC04_007142 [Tulasnella sp. 424]|nr:hypothetical protein FRC04_007142 [Tulasnella sp. 424]